MEKSAQEALLIAQASTQEDQRPMSGASTFRAACFSGI